MQGERYEFLNIEIANTVSIQIYEKKFKWVHSKQYGLLNIELAWMRLRLLGIQREHSL